MLTQSDVNDHEDDDDASLYCTIIVTGLRSAAQYNVPTNTQINKLTIKQRLKTNFWRTNEMRRSCIDVKKIEQ